MSVTLASRQRKPRGQSQDQSQDPQSVPSLREAQKQLACDRILEAALAVFAQQGYQSTTIDDVVKRAGLSRATFYLHFKSKGDIIAAFTAQSIEEFSTLYSVAPLHKQASESESEAWIDRLFVFYKRRFNRIIVFHQAIAADPDVQQMAEDSYALVIRDLTRRIGGRRISGPKAAKLGMRLRLYMGLTDSVCVMAVITGAVSRELACAELAALWRNFRQ